MAVPISLPQLGLTMEEGSVIKWHKADGETVAKREPLLEIETDKSAVEVEAPASGTLRIIAPAGGGPLPIGTVIGYLLAPGEQAPAEGALATPPHETGPQATVVQATITAAELAEPQADVSASPLARRLAREHGIDLRAVTGSGPRGRIVEADVMAAVRELEKPTEVVIEGSTPRAGPTTPTGAAAPEAETIPLSKLRRSTAERLTRSWQSTPHFFLQVDVDATEIKRLKGTLAAKSQAGAPPITYTAIIVRAAARALEQHPDLNAAFRGDHLLRFAQVNIGVATATQHGLLVPVLRDANRKGLLEIAAALQTLRSKAESLKFSAEEVSGGTFTVSNLGMYGVDGFIPVINPPEAAILGVGRVQDAAVVINGRLEVRPVLRLTLAVDHRVADGTTASLFLQTLREYLEQPYLLL